MHKIELVYSRLSKSALATDSFWAIIGNGLGYALLMISGVIIARILGKDIYGEYSTAKNTMLYMGAFAAFGLGSSSTRYVAKYIDVEKGCLRSIAWGSLKVTFVFSSLLSLLLIAFSDELALFINAPQLSKAFKYLSVLIVFRAVLLTSIGILSGYKDFKSIGLYHIYAGIAIVVLCLPTTLKYGIDGAFASLMFYQVVLCGLALLRCLKLTYKFPKCASIKIRELLKFSFPVMLQEFVGNISTFGVMLIITKYASVGDYGIYNASIQWNAIIIFIPSLLVNVVLSYLVSNSESNSHGVMLHKLLIINFVSSLIPFIAVFLLSGFIVGMYGPSFDGMQVVLNILILSTLFTSVTNVYQSDLISRNCNWYLFLIKLVTSIIIIVATFYTIQYSELNAALAAAVVTLIGSVLTFILLSYTSHVILKKRC